MSKKTVQVGNYLQVRITRFAAQQMDKLRQRLQSEIVANPHRYPLVAGKRLTKSDLIILLCEKANNERE